MTTTGIILSILVGAGILLWLCVISVPPSRHIHAVPGGGGGTEALTAVGTLAKAAAASSAASNAGAAASAGGATQTVAQRARAALLGALVADAATMGLHWLYGKSSRLP